MAKKPTVKGLFEKTESETKADATRRRRPVGVYLRVATRAEVEKIAQEEDLPLHAILAYGIAYFVRQYKAGKVKIETTQKTTLKMDV